MLLLIAETVSCHLKMTKTDQSLRNITIAAIKRSAQEKEKWRFTNFYSDSKSATIPQPIRDKLKLAEKELLVASSIASLTEWTVVTTRRILGNAGGILQELELKEVDSFHWGEFKDKENQTTKIRLTSYNSEDFYFDIETREGSIVMIYAIRTLINLNERNKNGS